MRANSNTIKANLLLVALTALLWALFNYVFHFDGLYGQDSYEYLRYTKALSLYLTDGTNPGDYFWPLYYPIVGALLSFVWVPGVSLQIISIFSFFVIAKYSAKILDLLYPNNTSATLYIGLFFILCPIAFRLSLSVMSDMLAVACITLCFYYGIVYMKKQNAIHLVLATSFGIGAIMTRYAAVVLLLPPGILLFSTILKSKNQIRYLPLLLVLIALLLIPHFVIRHSNSTDFLHHDWLKEWSVSNFLKADFHSGDGHSHYFLPNIAYAFLPVLDFRYFIGGVFLIYPFIKTWRKIIYKRLFGASFVLYALFLAGIPYQNNRYLFLSFPILLLLFFPAFNWIMEEVKGKLFQKMVVAAVVVCQIVLCFLALKPMMYRNEFEREIAGRISRYQSRVLYSFDVDVALQGRGLNFEYHNLWTQKYKSFEEDALVLFHPTKFVQKWRGQNLMLNWESLKRDYDLKKLAYLPDGWMLYKISKK